MAAAITAGCAQEKPIAAHNDLTANLPSTRSLAWEYAKTVTAKQDANNTKTRRRRGRKKVTPVFVDGELVSALRFAELPPTLAVTWHTQDDRVFSRRFSMSNYLSAIGVPLAKVKGLYLHGGRKTTVISGDEVRRAGDRIQFKFTRGTGGRPIYRHDGVIKSNGSIDKIRAVSIFVEQEAPPYVGGRFIVDGRRLKGLPFVTPPRLRGTRVYLDGRLVAQIKRRDVKDTSTTDLFGVLRHAGVDVDKASRAELVRRDEVVRQLTSRELQTEKLTVQAADRGRIAVEGVSNGAAIDAILLFASTKSVDRRGPPPTKLTKSGLKPVINNARGAVAAVHP